MSFNEEAIALLERIAVALEAQIVTVSESIGCDHPMDQRIDFGLTNGQLDWECKVCHWRTPCVTSPDPVG